MTRDIETFLANDQIARGLRRFMAHHPRHFAVTGSIAREVHLGLLGVDPAERTVGNVDLVVEGACSLPGSLATEFLCPHVHPAAPAGGVLIQLVHPQDAVRFDVFKAADRALARSSTIPFGAFSVPVLSLEDLYAKSVALLMKLGRGGTVAAKHANDFHRLRSHADAMLVEQAWRSYREPADPELFADAEMLAEVLVKSKRRQMVELRYSTDVSAKCDRCREWGPFRPASPQQVFDILGYI